MDPNDDCIVIRAHNEVPVDFLPLGMEGRWYTKAQMGGLRRITDLDGKLRAVVRPTDRFERREGDYASARVYEVRLP